MTTQEWLLQIRDADSEIETLRLAMFDAWLQVTRITAELDGIGVQSTPEPHKYDTLAVLDGAVGERLRELAMLKASAVRCISGVPDPQQRKVLTAYYVDCRTRDGRRKTWDMVGAELHMSTRQVRRIASAGIEALDAKRCP